MGQAKDALQKFYDLFGAGRVAETATLFDPSCITQFPTGPLSAAEHIQMAQAFKSGFPDSTMTVEHAVESGDEVVIVGRYAGTHTSDLHSPNGTIPATGKTIDLQFMDYARVGGNGTMVDHKVVFDQMAMLGQLGVLPPA
jgi:predicted ester cyclase